MHETPKKSNRPVCSCCAVTLRGGLLLAVDIGRRGAKGGETAMSLRAGEIGIFVYEHAQQVEQAGAQLLRCDCSGGWGCCRLVRRREGERSKRFRGKRGGKRGEIERKSRDISSKGSGNRQRKERQRWRMRPRAVRCGVCGGVRRTRRRELAHGVGVVHRIHVIGVVRGNFVIVAYNELVLVICGEGARAEEGAGKRRALAQIRWRARARWGGGPVSMPSPPQYGPSPSA